MMRRDERGFTLVELLVTLALTLVVLGSALTAIRHGHRSAAAGTTLSELNQNLRVSANLLIRDLLQTGQGIPTGGIPIPTGGTSADIVRPGPIGAELRFDDTWETLPAVSPGPSLGLMTNGIGTDIVTLLRSDPTLDAPEPLADIAPDGSTITFPPSVDVDDPLNGVTVGDLLMFSNANGNALQEVTGVAGQVAVFDSSAASGLNQRGAPQGSVLAIRNPDGTWPPTRVTRILMITYYVAESASGQDALPSLIRRVNYEDERLIGHGIDTLHLTWDLVDGLNDPSNVEIPEPPNTPHQIRKANLQLAARAADDPMGTPLRATLTTQVSLRSLAFVDRYR